VGFLDWLARLILGVPRARPGGAGGMQRPAWPQPAGRGPAPVPSRKPQVRKLGGLDASQFAPLSNEQVRARTGGIGSLWSNPWFGRRDLIPPPDDPRTRLIDQGMVGQGLITAEELVTIHEVGLQMDEIRPDLALAGQVADRAVRESREERERLKEQKKAEAAARKKKRAEEVARRRKTDIVFLGRGMSKGLADHRTNVEKLAANGLPVLATPADVAKALGLEIPKLRWLAYHSEASPVTHYVRFSVPKKSGGMRELAAPHRDLAAAQEWILASILDKLPVHAAAHGFVGGHSTVTNASPHASRDVIVNADLKDFFPSVTFPRVKGIFQGMGYSPAAATILALLCTECPRRTVEYAGRKLHVATGPRGLPQGACTSPALSNLVARKLDVRLAGLCSKLGWAYTRYADDLTFSGSGEPAKSVGYLLARIRHIVADEGFTVNEKKTRVLRRNTAQTVTGIVVNDRPGVSRRTLRRMRAILHRARREGIEAQNRDDHPHFASWLDGMIAYISMVNPGQGRPLREQFNVIRSVG
jgi:retron-type reverse transcriptase